MEASFLILKIESWITIPEQERRQLACADGR